MTDAFSGGLTVQYLHTDHLGSPVAATDANGAEVGTQSFYPFGEVRNPQGIFDTERGFTGQIADAATGLNFYNARYMDPTLGRFISPDSIVPSVFDPTLFNRYAYVANNPLKYTDPTGHDFNCQSTDCHGDDPEFQVAARNANAAIPNISGGDDSDHGESPAEFFWRFRRAVAGNSLNTDLHWAVNLAVDVLAPPIFSVGEIGQAFQGDGVDEGTLAAGIVGIVPAGKLLSRGGEGIVDLFAKGFDGVPSPAQAQDLVRSGVRVGSGLKDDLFHSIPANYVDDIQNNATVFRITGGDGLDRTLIQMPIQHNGHLGRVEWIVNDVGEITHEWFVRGGGINGIPNVP